MEKLYQDQKNITLMMKKNKFKEGDIVKIIESKPISKLKTWQVIEK